MCKYCMNPNYDWCCPSCFMDFEADNLYPKDEETEEDEEADDGEF